jgi:hypothetical protein
MLRFEVSGAVRPIYGSLGVQKINTKNILQEHSVSFYIYFSTPDDVIASESVTFEKSEHLIYRAVVACNHAKCNTTNPLQEHCVSFYIHFLLLTMEWR